MNSRSSAKARTRPLSVSFATSRKYVSARPMMPTFGPKGPFTSRTGAGGTWDWGPSKREFGVRGPEGRSLRRHLTPPLEEVFRPGCICGRKGFFSAVYCGDGRWGAHVGSPPPTCVPQLCSRSPYYPTCRWTAGRRSTSSRLKPICEIPLTNARPAFKRIAPFNISGPQGGQHSITHARITHHAWAYPPIYTSGAWEPITGQATFFTPQMERAADIDSVPVTQNRKAHQAQNEGVAGG